jgi:hypothetical protein
MRRGRTDPAIGREVTWTEDGCKLTGQVWARCPDAGPGPSIYDLSVGRYERHEFARFRETATHGPGPLYWIVTTGGQEFRTASYNKATDAFTVGYWIWAADGTCVRDGRASA